MPGILLATLGLLYLLQLLTPLRLNGDAIWLLEIGQAVARGQGFTYHGVHTHYPPGYPLIVAGLAATGLRTSSMLVLINLICLTIALWSASSLALLRFESSAKNAIWIVATCASSFVIVKHVTLPLSDTVYLGLSLAALVTICKFEDRPGSVLLILSCLLVIISIAIRTVGVALIPALAWAIGGSWVRRQWRRSGFRYVAGVTFALILALGAFMVLHTRYGREAATIYAGASPIGALTRNVTARLSEMGELTINMPMSRLPAIFSTVAPLLGVPLCFLLGVAIWQRRNLLGAIEVYLLSYVAILFLWPYSDARFWIPVVPLLVLYGTKALRAREARIFAGWLLATGTVALVYSTRLSLMSSREFASNYGTAQLRPAYTAAALGMPLPSTADVSTRDAYHLLLTSN